MYEYKAKVLKVVDGDTADLEVDLGFDLYYIMRVRFFGINAPETRGPEKPQGLVTKKFVKEAIFRKNIIIKTSKDAKGKFGRYLVTIYYGDKKKNLNKELLDKKLARENYYGSKVRMW